MTVLDVQGLTVDFSTKGGKHHILKNVALNIGKGEIVGLIGESGSGKSTLAMTILDINSKNREMYGNIRFRGEELSNISKERMRKLRGKHIGFVPQSSMNALNPLIKIEKQFTETIKTHTEMPAQQMFELTSKTLEMVAIDPSRTNSFPYEFSGGQRQRIMIALSMLLSPELIIADEPTTALDATVQSRIIDLLKEVVEQKHTSMLVISHDLHTISRICDRIYIMYGGRIVEVGSTEQIIHHPKHPYTQKLLSSRIPLMAEPVKVKGISGKPPSTLIKHSRCEFLERCDRASVICEAKRPPECIGNVRVACHFGEGHE
ncbi:ABC transporter ATP-binding protein [Methanolobus vulcani]|uniref:Nickel import system ATP-binding protein NikD n=1 Tax=Methanolobus vulcani TaxID=38026 RepID=A0A7Z8KQZ6_9EURY|nr:ABC transporter ATP-binding protein [Methanolobus vulcani]TQD27646.1 ABC transporter ATP-binding protein [Methanolobus vulcani]